MFLEEWDRRFESGRERWMGGGETGEQLGAWEGSTDGCERSSRRSTGQHGTEDTASDLLQTDRFFGDFHSAPILDSYFDVICLY